MKMNVKLEVGEADKLGADIGFLQDSCIFFLDTRLSLPVFPSCEASTAWLLLSPLLTQGIGDGPAT